jgi:hypothetical protein
MPPRMCCFTLSFLFLFFFFCTKVFSECIGDSVPKCITSISYGLIAQAV